ncbi:unnamed protein product [Haemonchus placei]|uniref:Uncharacterized protein n=1 Tax=Haemonchus placei TaxID=6290 RepID=A0A0N4WSZ7_HAEPC|nr:unnamed protein product [Haemonchus placei]
MRCIRAANVTDNKLLERFLCRPSGSDTVESVQFNEKTVSTPSDVVFEEEQSSGSDIVYESVPAGPSCSEDISTVPETPELAQLLGLVMMSLDFALTQARYGIFMFVT